MKDSRIEAKIKECTEEIDILDVQLPFAPREEAIKILSNKLQLIAYVESLGKLKHVVSHKEKEEIQLQYELYKLELQYIVSYLMLNIGENEEEVSKISITGNMFKILKCFENILDIKKIKIYKDEKRIKLIA